jgi:hypothetical protein
VPDESDSDVIMRIVSGEPRATQELKPFVNHNGALAAMWA